jgi:hypothetical protein
MIQKIPAGLALGLVMILTSWSPAPARPDNEALKLDLARRIVHLANPFFTLGRQRLVALVRSSCTRPGSLRKVIKAYDDFTDGVAIVLSRQMSLASLRTFVHFYNTPVGRKLIGSQMVMLREFGRASLMMAKRLWKRQPLGSLADSIPLKGLDRDRLAAARALAVRSQFFNWLTRSWVVGNLQIKGITAPMLAEFWSRLVAKLLTLSDIKALGVFYRGPAYRRFMAGLPRLQAQILVSLGPYQQALYRVLSDCR